MTYDPGSRGAAGAFGAAVARAPRDGRTDAALIASTLDGDRDAFSALVRRHQNALYRYARGLGMEHDVALDLLQDTFVKAYVGLEQCRDRDRFTAWLFRILRNTMLDWLKDVRRSELPLPELTEPTDPEDVAERQALRAALGDALAALPPILREAFLLRHQHGHPYEEIASIAGISLSAAKMRVSRARDALREALAPEVMDVTSDVQHSS